MNPNLAAEVLPSTPCDQALAIWFEQHKAYIRGGTVRTYRQYITTLSSFFHAKPLAEIGVTEVRAYQAWRKETCGATRINGELCALQMCMKEADLWTPIAKLYRPLPVPKTKVRQNMSEEEERRLLKVALDPKMPRRLLAGHCLVVMANTSMGFGELRHLRRQDVFLTEDPPFIEVNAGKNDYRLRSIPLNFLALRSMRWIVKRWEGMGGSDPDQYILPHHARRTAQEKAQPGHTAAGPIFEEPMGHIYRAARAILKDAGLDHLDPYDMRSHAITKLLSDPNVSDQMYTEIVGHVGNAMKRRYSKQRMENKRGAMDAMCRTQVDLCEQQAELEVLAGKQQVESEVRTSLGPPEKPGVAEARAQRCEQIPTPQGQVPNIEQPSIQAEIDRRVALALAERRGISRTSEKLLRKRLIRGRRSAGSANRQQVGVMRPPSAPNVVSFPGPRRA
jgi:integrase